MKFHVSSPGSQSHMSDIPKVFMDSAIEPSETSYIRDRNRSASSENSSLLHNGSHIYLPHGSVLGVDQYFVRRPDIQIRTYLVSENLNDREICSF